MLCGTLLTAHNFEQSFSSVVPWFVSVDFLQSVSDFSSLIPLFLSFELNAYSTGLRLCSFIVFCPPNSGGIILSSSVGISASCLPSNLADSIEHVGISFFAFSPVPFIFFAISSATILTISCSSLKMSLFISVKSSFIFTFISS